MNFLCKIQSFGEYYELSLLDTDVESGNQPQYQCRKIHHILEIDTSFEGYVEINDSLNNVLDWEMTYLDPDSIPAFKPYDGANKFNQLEVPVSSKRSSFISLKSSGTDDQYSHEFSKPTTNEDNLVTVEGNNIDLTVPLPVALKQQNWQLVLMLLARFRIYNDENHYKQLLREVFFFACLPGSSHLAPLFIRLPQLDISQPFESDCLFRQYLVPLLSIVVSRTYPLPNELPYTHICCITQQHHILKLILELELGRPGDRDLNRHTPLHVACVSSSLDCAQLLIDSGADVNALSKLHHIPTPLYCAVLSSSPPQLLTQLLQASASFESKQSIYGTVLHLAAALGNVKLAEILIRGGSDINSQVYVNWESLATLFKHKRLHRQISMPRTRLMSNHSFFNQFDKRLSTPLMVACALGNIKIIELLLKNNADIHLQDCHQDTTIFYAAGEWYHNIVEMLIMNGADVNAKNCLNDTPMLQALKATQHQRCVRSHSQKSGDIEQLILTVETLVRNNADINYENPQGNSFVSLFLQHWHTCHKLLELAGKFDLNLDVADRDGNTLLLYACQHGWSNTVRVLLINHVNIEVSDGNGNSPLLIACENGYDELAKLLLQVGADPFQENLDGLTPLLTVVKRGDAHVLDLIISGGYMRCEQLRSLTSQAGQPLPWAVAAKAGDDRVLSRLIKNLLWEDNIPFKEMFRKGLSESIHWWLLHPVYFLSCNPRQNTGKFLSFLFPFVLKPNFLADFEYSQAMRSIHLP